MAAAGSAAGRAPQTVADATHDLYRQYGKQIYAYCLHQLRSREEAEDAVQTTFLNAFRGLQRGTTTRFEQAWLYKIAQNVCIARRSSSGRRLRLESPDDFEILQEVVPTPASAEGDTLELMGLDAALDSMPENQRRAILMREWQGMSYREVATELGLTQGAVEMLIFRARRTLAHALEQPAAEKKRASTARAGFSLGSIAAAMQPLFSTGAAAKVAAVAVAAAVVGTNGAVHSVISHAETPARKAAVTTTRPRLAAVRPFVAARHTLGSTPRKPVKAPVPRRTAPAPETPVGAPDVQPAPQSAPAGISTPTTAPTSEPPAQMPVPAPQQTPAATSAPSTQAKSPQTESQRPPIAPAESGAAIGADATGDGQPVQTHDVENTRDTQDVPQPPNDGATTTTAPVTTSTPPRDAVANSTPVVPDSNPTPPPTPTTTTTTTTTTTATATTTTATTTTTPSTPPVPQTTAPGDGRHGDGGRHGHH